MYKRQEADGAAGGAGEDLGHLRAGQLVGGDLDGAAEVVGRGVEGVGGELPDVLGSDELQLRLRGDRERQDEFAVHPLRAHVAEVGDEEGGAQHGRGQAELGDVPLDLALAREVRHLAGAAGAVDGGVHEVRDARPGGGLGDRLALADLALVAGGSGQRHGLDAEDAVHAAHGRLQGALVVEVAADQDRTVLPQGAGRRAVRVADERADGPAAGEQGAGGGTALPPGGAGDQDGAVVGHGGLLDGAYSGRRCGHLLRAAQQPVSSTEVEVQPV